MKIIRIYLAVLAAFLTCLLPNISFASCGSCSSAFDVGTAATLPTRVGGIAFVEFNHIKQVDPWDKKQASPNRADAHHQSLNTSVYNAGMQYMFNRSWGAMIKAPYVEKRAVLNHHGEENGRDHNALGDIKLTGIYSGFSSNMATGIIFGLKLPTGATKQDGFHTDMQIGTGSTDAILGGYNLGKFGKSNFGHFSQITWQKVIFHNDNYNPGSEVSGSTGLYYNLEKIGGIAKVSPMIQLIGTHKQRDTGPNSDTNNSGFNRLSLAPGIEVNINQVRIFADVSFPFYQYVNGEQLAVNRVIRVLAGYKF